MKPSKKSGKLKPSKPSKKTKIKTVHAKKPQPLAKYDETPPCAKTAARTFSIVGTILVLIPILAPLFFMLVKFARSKMEFLMFDYLMPAELFPVALIGGIFLVISSVLSRKICAFIIGAFITAAVLLVGGQVFAIATGLASGETEPEGWIWIAVLASISIYTLSLVAMGIGGILLIRCEFEKKSKQLKKS